MSRLSGMRVLDHLSHSDWATLVDTVIETDSVTVPGAQVGDFVMVAVERAGTTDAAEAIVVGRVTAADTVTLQIFPDAGGGGLPASTPIHVKVIPKDHI